MSVLQVQEQGSSAGPRRTISSSMNLKGASANCVERSFVRTTDEEAANAVLHQLSLWALRKISY